jgi:ubiquinone/menaquinone biosynthesis C-methylase UbiE
VLISRFRIKPWQLRSRKEERMGLLPGDIERHYSQSEEWQRLSAGQGELERLRTLAILAREMPPAPAVVYDIGGGAGVYSFALAQQHYEVHLIDPVALHLEQARAHANASGIALRSIEPGDARKLDIPPASADAILLLGPLYHLTEAADRLRALREAFRILKPSGVVFAAAISRFASLIDGLREGFFQDAGFRKIVAADLASGQHRNPVNHPAYFTTAYFHRPEELSAEVRSAGFHDVKIIAVEGPAWSAKRFGESWNDAPQREKLMEFLSVIEQEPSILGASAHLLAVAKRPG